MTTPLSDHVFLNSLVFSCDGDDVHDYEHGGDAHVKQLYERKLNVPRSDMLLLELKYCSRKHKGTK